MTTGAASPAAARPEPGPVTIAGLMALFVFAEAANTMFVPVMPAMRGEFGAADAVVQYTLSGYILTFGLGNLVCGPLSDRFGRRPVALAGLALFTLGALVAVQATDIWIVILGRVLQGAGAAAGFVVSRAAVRDRFPPAAAPRILSYLFFGLAVMLVLAPIAGGQLAHLLGWHAVFLAQAALAVLLFAGCVPLLAGAGQSPRGQGMRPPQVVSAYAGLLRNPRYLAYLVPHACAYSAIIAFLAGGAFALSQQALDHRELGLALGIGMTGYLLGAIASAQAHRRLGWGIDRLVWIAALWMTCATIALLALRPGYGLSAASFLGLQIAIIFAAGLMSPNTAAGVMAQQPQRAGLAAALLGSVQKAAAAAVTVIVVLMLPLIGGIVVPVSQFVLGVTAVLSFHDLLRRGAARAAAEELPS
ncbi:MFS transporter [Marinibaculum pumilum]|uniref:MFS transporter n=1 Tax=Marinibaculum pumilum TaxID=1766165 RepID=A0ABV7L2M2_9PROT